MRALSRAAWCGVLGLLCAVMLAGCGGGDGAGTPAGPAISEAQRQLGASLLPPDASDAVATLSADEMPPDTASQLDDDELPPAA